MVPMRVRPRFFALACGGEETTVLRGRPDMCSHVLHSQALIALALASTLLQTRLVEPPRDSPLDSSRGVREWTGGSSRMDGGEFANGRGRVRTELWGTLRKLLPPVHHMGCGDSSTCSGNRCCFARVGPAPEKPARACEIHLGTTHSATRVCQEGFVKDPW